MSWLEKFSNRYIRRICRETWRAKEDALRLHAGCNNEALSKATSPLRPLSCGDRVFIQNQNGNHLRKWDKVGAVVEVSKYDQYVIKVSGSGCLTTRNRRFLKLIPAPVKPTTKDPLGSDPTTPLKRYQRQPQVSASTSVNTETPIGVQGEN